MPRPRLTCVVGGVLDVPREPRSRLTNHRSRRLRRHFAPRKLCAFGDEFRSLRGILSEASSVTRDCRCAPSSFRGESEAAAVLSSSPCMRKSLAHSHLRLPAIACARLWHFVALAGRNTALPPKSCAAFVAVQLSARGLVAVSSRITERSRTGHFVVRLRSTRSAYHRDDLGRRLIGSWRCA